MVSRLKKILKWTFYSILILIIIGFIYQSISEISDKRKFPPIGKIYELDGVSLHLHTLGEGEPTVLLIPGGGDIEAIWDPIQKNIKDKATVISYDRPGLGNSSFYNGDDLDVVKQADLLYQVLEKSEHSGPFIVIGHSLGGLIARNFAQKYRRDVVGIILVDSSVEGQFSKLPKEILDMNKSAGAIFSIANVIAKVGLHRLLGMGSAKANSFDLLSEEAQQRIAASLHQSRGFKALQKDGAVANEIMENGERFPDAALDSIPLTVITRGLAEHEANKEAKFNDEQIKLFTETQSKWLEIQKDLLRISSNSNQVIARNSGHYIHTSEPELVINEIEKIIRSYKDASR